MGRRWISALVTAALLFLAIALFTPLHQHRNGKCTMNNIEYCSTDGVATAVNVPNVPSFSEQAPADSACDRESFGIRQVDVRGPPPPVV